MKPGITIVVGILGAGIAVVGIATAVFGVLNQISPDLVSWLKALPPSQVVMWGTASFVIGLVISNLVITQLDRTSGP